MEREGDAADLGDRIDDVDALGQQPLGIHPAIGKVFSFDQIPEAFRVQASGDFVGKIAITI